MRLFLMKRLATVLVFVLLITGIAASIAMAYLGHRIETVYRGYLADVDRESEFELRLARYEQGMLKSDAEFTLETTFGPGVSLTTVHKHIIHHGPLLPASGCGSGMGLLLIKGTTHAGNNNATVQHFFGGRPISEECIFVDFVGVVRGRSVVPAFRGMDVDQNGEPVENTEIEWQPVRADWTYEDDKRRVTVDLKAPLLLWSDGEVDFAMRSIGIVADQSTVSETLNNGEMQFTVGALEVTDTSNGLGSIAVLKNLLISGSIKIGAQTVDVGMGFEFDGFDLDEDTVGKGTYRVSMTELSREGLETYWQRMQDLEQQDLDADELRRKTSGLLMQFVPDLVSTSPALNFDTISQQTPHGDVLMSGYIRFHGDGFHQIIDPLEILTRLEVDLHFDISQDALAYVLMLQNRDVTEQEALDSGATLSAEDIDRYARERVGAMLDTMVAMEVLRMEGASYLCDLLIKNGLVTINGESADEVVELLKQNWGQTT